MSHLVAVFHDIHQVALVEFYVSVVILALDLNCHLRTLPDLQLHFLQLEESTGGY